MIFILIVGVIALGVFGLSRCENIKRGVKSITSNVDGLDRVVKVYDNNGKLIKEYKGKIDLKENEYGNKVLFDLNGKRITVNNAIVITEEQ